MEYTDIEKASPKRQGIYEIIIENADTGEQRFPRANYKMDTNAWHPFDDYLRGSDFVKAWREIEH